jgi:hypothetical protein
VRRCIGVNVVVFRVDSVTLLAGVKCFWRERRDRDAIASVWPRLLPASLSLNRRAWRGGRRAGYWRLKACTSSEEVKEEEKRENRARRTHILVAAATGDSTC